MPLYLKRRFPDIERGFFYICIRTQKLNDYILGCRSIPKGILDAWFTIGCLVSTLLTIPATVFFIYKVTQSLLFYYHHGEKYQSALTLLVPGLNLPFGEIGYYLVAIFTCSLLHELGHAVAAVNEGIRISDTGFILMLGICPMSFVHLPTHLVEDLSALRKLRIFTAGVWHNLFSTLLIYALLRVTPSLTTPLYTYQSAGGIAVTEVDASSTARGPSGLVEGDILSQINGCPLKIVANWSICIERILLPSNTSFGFCLDTHVESELLISEDKCCEDKNSSGPFMCFHGFTTNEPSRCLNPRQVSYFSSSYCQDVDHYCPNGQFCLRPLLEEDDGYFLEIERVGKMSFLYVGNPTVLYRDVYVSDYSPRFRGWVNVAFLRNLPDMLEKLCYYMVAFSASLAVVNVVPCYRLDGEFIVDTLMEAGVCPAKKKITKKRIKFCFIATGTFFVASNFLLGIVELFKKVLF